MARMGIREIYHSAEDKWYGFLDTLDSKHIPVYAVVDPIDTILPSLAVVLTVLVVALGTLVLPFIGIGGGSDIVLSFTDSHERTISGLSVDLTFNNQVQTKITNSVGKIILKGISMGTEIGVSVDDPQYQTLSTSEKIIEQNQKLTFTLTPRKVVPSQLSFQFVDGGHQSLDGKTLFVSLTCANGNTPNPNTYTVTTGTLSLSTSEECESLVGSISGNGIQTKDGVLFSASNAVITLSTISTEKGKAKITVRNAEDSAALENMDVELFSAQGLSMQTITTNTFGVAIFNNIPVGEYYASASDGAGEFALTTSESFMLSANQTTPVEMKLGKQVQGTLSVSVTAKTGNAWIANATIKLIQKTTNKLLATKTTTTQNEPITLDVAEKGPFLLTATHPDYLSDTKELLSVSGAQTAAFALEKLTAQNSGKIVVNVTDEDGLNVDNAQVLLYDTASGFLYHAANPAITDMNGNAKFSGIPSGNYFARATKYPAGPSDSSNFTSDKSISTQTKITLTIGQAVVQAVVKDKDGSPLPFSTVEFLTDGTDECLAGKCAVQTDVQGVAQKSFKADRKIYIRARAAGYTTYTSASYQLYPALTRTIEAKLPKTILGQTPKVSFVDVRDPVTGLSARDMKSGKTYLAVFQMQVPSSLNSLDGGGMQIRVGREELIENDILAITGVNAPGAVTVKGTSYQPGIAFAEGDELNLTNGDAKWVNIVWNSLVPGVYEVSAIIRVSEEASNMDELPFYYRAWVNDGATYLRDPADVILGTSQTSAQKENQYAEAYQKIYFNGKSIVCDESFCYSGENVLNQDDQLLVDGPPYNLSINKKFTYSFVLTSNSPTVYQAPKLRVFVSNDAVTPSSEALFSDYSVTRPDGQELQGSGLSTKDIPGGGEGNGLDLGRLEQFKTMVGQYTFTSKLAEGTNVVVQVINEGSIVFEQLVPLEIATGQGLILTADPTTAAAFIPTTFRVRVRDSEGFDIQDALVSLLKIDPNKIQQFVTRQYTDIEGRASFIAPSSLPNTHFVIDAVKGGYASSPITIVVDENVAVFAPQKLSFSLPNAPNTEQFLPLDITNQTQQGFILSKAVITGPFQGLLSNGEMQNYVNQYVNVTTIGSLETKTIQVKASTSASVSLVANKTLTGTLVLTFKNTQTNQEWVQVVPFDVSLRVIGECDDEAIQLSGTPASGTLNTTAFDNKSQTPFQISNICTVDGQPYPLKNLKSKIVWKSNPIGNVELATTDIEGSEQSQEVLRSGAYTILFGLFKSAEESTYESILTFTPFPQNIGETADFTIFIAGEIGSGNNIRTVEEEFDVKIKVTNLETCVKFDPEPEEEIVLKRGEEKVEFEIDSSACGEVDVDISFCTGSNNSNCSGGAPEGKLFLLPFSINNLNGKKTITITRQGSTLPGSYDLTVDASVPGVSPYRIAALNVKVESGDDYVFDIERTGFSLYQRGAMDSSAVINRLLQESVKVKADVCDWGDAADHGLNITGTNAAIGAVSGVAFSYFGTAYITGFVSSTFWCPWCIAAAVVVTVILSLFDDSCDDMVTNTLLDYVINLAGGANKELVPPDAINITLSSNVNSHVRAKWVTEASNVFVDDDGGVTQTVGLTVENLSGYTNVNPLFGVMTLASKIHDNGDPTHTGNASVKCNNGNFANFYIGPAIEQGSCSPADDSGIHAEKFHVKFRTQDVNQSLPKLNFDSVACVSGTTLGSTGAGSVPQVAFNWSWNNATGIPLYACDASNENAIYCDATQFNIDLMKRVHALDDFLEANDYAFDCPDDPNATPSSSDYPTAAVISAGMTGVSSVGYRFNSTTAVELHATVTNNTSTIQTGTMVARLHPLDISNAIDLTCQANISIPAGQSAEAGCTISPIAPISYRASIGYGETASTSGGITADNTVFNLDAANYDESVNGTCNLPKSTVAVNGRPLINAWIDKNDPLFGKYIKDGSVRFTPLVPDVEALNDLLHYDAYLIHDGYSKDFENDFRDFYSSTSFADAPVWFTGGNGLPGYHSFYGDDDTLMFSNKYFEDTTLPSAGKYRVEIGATFLGDDWKIVDSNGSTNAIIAVDFYHLKNPVPNSPFYRLPFDGQIGLTDTQYSRVGYGLEYINETNPIKVNDSTVQTQPGEESSALAQANVEYEDDLRVMNSIPSTRGNILEITSSNGNAPARIVFTPSLATPTVMKITHATTTQPFTSFYQIAQNGSPVDTGSTLAFWEGAGNCYDYTSVPVYEKFNYSPDRAANTTDKLTAWQYSYALDWPYARVGGNEYLRTIFYTPAQGSYSINSASDFAKFFTTNTASPSTSQTLDGINTLPYNNASQVIDSMQDVFDLVADGKICVSDSGNKARFFWNPETLYKQTSQTSVSAFTNGLVAGTTCLGPPA